MFIAKFINFSPNSFSEIIKYLCELDFMIFPPAMFRIKENKKLLHDESTFNFLCLAFNFFPSTRIISISLANFSFITVTYIPSTCLMIKRGGYRMWFSVSPQARKKEKRNQVNGFVLQENEALLICR